MRNNSVTYLHEFEKFYKGQQAVVETLPQCVSPLIRVRLTGQRIPGGAK